MMTIIAFLFALAILIFFHELGHFIFAKIFKVRVETFSLGFGKRLIGKRWGETDYRISLIPMGGYVKLAGENPFEESTGAPWELNSKPKWQRFIIFCAGPGMNMLFGFLAFSLFYILGYETPAFYLQPPQIYWVEKGSPADIAGIIPGDLILKIDDKEVKNWEELMNLLIVEGRDRDFSVALKRGADILHTKIPLQPAPEVVDFPGFVPDIPPRIDKVMENSPALEAGLKPGDMVLEINGNKIAHYFQMHEIIIKNEGIPLNFKVKRGDEVVELSVTPKILEKDGKPAIGVLYYYDMVIHHHSLFKSVYLGFKRTIEVTAMIMDFLVKLIRGEVSASNLGGPIAIAKITGEAAKSGLNVYVLILAFISINLAILNLLPIPVLDGGHILLLVIEVAIRKPLSAKFKERSLQFGLLIVIALMCLALFNDISNFISKEKIFSLFGLE